MSKSNKGRYFLVGSILGFILGLFLAPKKGSELRKEAKEKIDEIKEIIETEITKKCDVLVAGGGIAGISAALAAASAAVIAVTKPNISTIPIASFMFISIPPPLKWQ